MVQRTPLHDVHVRAGARMVEFAGWDMPVQYEGILAEHAAVRERAGLFDVSHMGEVVFRGPKALESLQRLFTNDLSRCQDGQAQYGALCRESGGIVDDVVVYRRSAEDLLVCVNASNRQKDYDWLHGHAFGAEVTNESDAWGQLALQGPRGPEIPPAPATPARTASSSSAPRRRVRGCGPPWSRRASRRGSVPAGSARATPCASRWPTDSTGPTWTTTPRRSRRAWAGW